MTSSTRKFLTILFAAATLGIGGGWGALEYNQTCTPEAKAARENLKGTEWTNIHLLSTLEWENAIGQPYKSDYIRAKDKNGEPHRLIVNRGFRAPAGGKIKIVE